MEVPKPTITITWDEEAHKPDVQVAGFRNPNFVVMVMEMAKGLVIHDLQQQMQQVQAINGRLAGKLRG